MAEPNKRFCLMAEVTAKGNRRGEVMIYSGISRYTMGDNDPTVTSAKFDKALKALGDVDEITIRINSPGGAVSEATAIRTMLEKHPAKKTIDIEGMCASAATIIACMPGVHVRMAKGGDYMIHRCSMIAWGNADNILSAYNSMVNTDKVMAGYYAERTGMTEDECMELMKAETWYTGETALEAGFVDEIIGADESDESIVACASDALDLMCACYDHVPERLIKCAQVEANNNPVSNGSTAVAADGPSENNQNEGVNTMDELRNATAEQLQQENPALAQSIAENAVAAERSRIQEIDALTPEGAEYAQMAREAKANGTSAADFLKSVIARQSKARQDYLTNRQRETEAANHVGGGDASDNDDDNGAKIDSAAKEIAEIAKGMNANSFDMA